MTDKLIGRNMLQTLNLRSRLERRWLPPDIGRLVCFEENAW